MNPAPESRFDGVGLLLGRWRRLVLCAAVGATAGGAYALYAPAWYQARLSVVPSQRALDGSSLASKVPVGLNSLTTEVQRIQAVLTSTSVADEVIDKFGLEQRYATSDRSATRSELGSHCDTSIDRKSGVVSLTCEDKAPRIAMEMAAYFGEVGNRVFGRISTSSAREERRFLETQVAKFRQDVETSSRKLREFQEQSKVIDLAEQSKAVISAMASITGDMLSKQLELSYLHSFSSDIDSSVVQLQRQVAIMRNNLKQLEGPQRASTSQPSSVTSPASFFPEAMSIPMLRFELEHLLREQKIHETLFFMMMQRYEMSKVDEARDISMFQILDNPTLPTRKSRPQRTKIVGLGGFAGLALACAWIIVPTWFRRRLSTSA